jgi:hypothetical protein
MAAARPPADRLIVSVTVTGSRLETLTIDFTTKIPFFYAERLPNHSVNRSSRKGPPFKIKSFKKE